MAKTSVPLTSDPDKGVAPGEIRVTPLVRVFEQLNDWRKARGKVYSLASLLVLMLAGLMCGKRGAWSIARWFRKLPFATRIVAGFPLGRSPSAVTLFRLLWNIDAIQLEAAIRGWIAEVNERLDGAGLSWRIAIDGKTLRGAAKRGAQAAHLLAAVSHELKTVLAQVPVDDKTNEITAVISLLDLLVLKGRLVTVDALLTQKAIAQAIRDRGGDYLMVVKENQPQLLQDIGMCFGSEPLPGEERGTARTLNKGHGRLEEREIVTSSALKDFLADWPGLEQVLKITHTVIHLKTGNTTKETVFAITSLPVERGSPRTLLEASRGHWIIENSVHWVRDVTLGEDSCAVHKNRAHQVLAALRNLLFALVWLDNYKSIAAAVDEYSAQPLQAFRSMGPTTGL
jgi:predicted transposase YbfD/YdcC